MATLATTFRVIDSDSSEPPATREGRCHRLGQRARITLQLQYRISPFGDYVFFYQEAEYSPPPAATLFASAINRLIRFTLMLEYRFRNCLDIGIIGCDTVVQVDTFGPDLSWSLTSDAVTTLEDHSDLYGELRYWDGTSWKKREEFGKPSCQRIRFLAKYNSGGLRGEKHKFSYNVLLRDSGGNLVEHEIDPDIQNPKV
jgi:hypothetical protein